MKWIRYYYNPFSGNFGFFVSFYSDSSLKLPLRYNVVANFCKILVKRNGGINFYNCYITHTDGPPIKKQKKQNNNIKTNKQNPKYYLVRC